MRLFTPQSLYKMAAALIAVVVLQFVGGNLGMHQLHLGEHEEESAAHPHIQFTADVITLAECVDCACAFDSPEQAAELEVAHSHTVSKTESKNFDLCLDCPCHGGHVTAMSHVAIVPSVPVGDVLNSIDGQYLPPEQLPNYRPPIV
ncbi:hypothetical protein L2740_15185 [Shewanella pneumatophori]|uniref:Uncharacterized protein n=2 Tax=Shewanella pneumatophori TaxID=314092 RepID=A0A9X1ZL66_9GAMM|nr:hypothetical protein [Shewanella pneumatophori]MCL1139888.1 hypothetical protein [Shewanella pneumatophori]